MIRIGLICSAGGSPIRAAIQLLRQQGYLVKAALITDRACGAETMAHDLNFAHRRIVFDSREQFSHDAAHWLFDDQDMDCALLLFSRIVTHELFDRATCFNLHPSLLPAFSGLGAVEKAQASSVRFFGATIHRVDASVDGGPIVGQIVTPVPISADLTTMQRLSFAQKLYLILVLAERLNGSSERTPRIGFAGGYHMANPGLSDAELERAFVAYLNEEGISWTM